MPMVCTHCGAYAMNNAERSLDHATCTACGQTTPMNVFPLFIVTGTSGAGKTVLVPELRKHLPECIIFDKDLLLASYGEHFYNNWLLIAHSIAQGGRHCVICGTIMPWDFENCEARELVGTLHFLNLHCNDAIREKRLRARPSWRQSSSDEFIQTHKRLAQWFLEHATTAFDPPMPTVDTSTTPVQEVARQIAQWITTVLDGRLVREPSPLF